MKYLAGIVSDTGICKKINQDSALLEIAESTWGKIVFAVVCDGMGGLSRGEYASSMAVASCQRWFENDFPGMLKGGFTEEKMNQEWNLLLEQVNQRLAKESAGGGYQMGTTLTALLLCGENYYIVHVGDSRIYKIKEQLLQLTKDHTYVQRELDAGRMRKEEVKTHPGRNLLLQCIGIGEKLSPQFVSGVCKEETVFLNCSDGFRHVLKQEEIAMWLSPEKVATEKELQEKLCFLIWKVKQRKETDNITAIAVKVCGKERDAEDWRSGRGKI